MVSLEKMVEILQGMGYNVFKSYIERPYYIDQQGRTMEWIEEDQEWRKWVCQ